MLLVLVGKYNFLFLLVKVVVVYCIIMKLEFMFVFFSKSLGMFGVLFFSDR